MPTNLALVYNKCLEFILESNAVSRNQNLKNVEYKALQSLSDNNEIVIKKADKGSNIVIMNKSDYINEGLTQLSNEKFYKKLKTNPTSSYRERIHLILKHTQEEKQISEKVFQYLIKGGTRTSIFIFYQKSIKEEITLQGDQLYRVLIHQQNAFPNF